MTQKKLWIVDIDGTNYEATTSDGTEPYRRYADGGYYTNERVICTCGRTCECAGDTRCNRCQETIRKAYKGV